MDRLGRKNLQTQGLRGPVLSVMQGTFTSGAAPTVTEDAENLLGDTAQGTAPVRDAAGLFTLTFNGLFGNTPKPMFQYIANASNQDITFQLVGFTASPSTNKTAMQFRTKAAAVDTDPATGSGWILFLLWDDVRLSA
jgi:hypothetical protein